MAPNKDMRRSDLVVPYQQPVAKNDAAEFSSTLSSTMPMAAMFTRNKFIGWAGVVLAVQSWLGESADSKRKSSTPGYLGVFLAIMALGVTYMPLFIPNVQGPAGTGTEAPAPVPPS